VAELTALPVFGGRKQRRSAQVWLTALEAARQTTDPPPKAEPPNGPPPAVRWSKRKPEAAARLDSARKGLTEVSQRVSVPTENLVSPDLVRRLCWDWDCSEAGAGAGAGAAAAIEEFLRAGQARAWQRDLVVPVLAEKLAQPSG